MSPAELSGSVVIQEAAPRIQALIARLNAGDLLAGYSMGVLVWRMRSRHDRYGTKLVARVARASGVSKTQLYAWEQVARDWSEREFARMVRLRGPHGERLKAGHALALAGVRPRRAQDAWIRAILKDGLTVRDVIGRLRRADGRNAVPVATVA